MSEHMPRELVNANITHVSYVDKAVNQKRFFMKSEKEKQHDFQGGVGEVVESCVAPR